ncbi:MAG: hypothetical protein QXI39_03150 [Candidatus Bathyarchaeia archaeon]
MPEGPSVTAWYTRTYRSRRRRVLKPSLYFLAQPSGGFRRPPLG